MMGPSVLMTAAMLLPLLASGNRVLFVLDEATAGTANKYAAVMETAAAKGAFRVEQEVLRKESAAGRKLLDEDDDVPSFHTVYLLASRLPDGWTDKQMIEHVQRGGNLVIAADAEVNQAAGQMRPLLNQLGLDLLSAKKETRHQVVAHGSADGKDASLQWIPSHVFGRDAEDRTVKLNELASSVTAFKLLNDPRAESTFNPLIQTALGMAPGTLVCPVAGTGSDDQNKCFSASQSVTALATLETRHGARVAVLGSPRLFLALSASKRDEIVGWVQGRRHRYRIDSLDHAAVLEDQKGRIGNRGISPQKSTIYRVRDRLRVRLCLSAWRENEHGSSGGWTRFTPSVPGDYQFELKVMDVQVRQGFTETDDSGCLIGWTTLPTTPAIYTLRVAHFRAGQSQLSQSARLLVRPMRHNEYPRFLLIALPYYVSWFSLLVGAFFILLPSLTRKK